MNDTEKASILLDMYREAKTQESNNPFCHEVVRLIEEHRALIKERDELREIVRKIAEGVDPIKALLEGMEMISQCKKEIQELKQTITLREVLHAAEVRDILRSYSV